MRTKDEQILQDWIPSGDIVTRFFNYENMIAFAKHYEKQKQGQKLPIQNVRLSCLHDVWQKWCDAKTTKEFDEWLHDEMHEA